MMIGISTLSNRVIHWSYEQILLVLTRSHESIADMELRLSHEAPLLVMHWYHLFRNWYQYQYFEINIWLNSTDTNTLHFLYITLVFVFCTCYSLNHCSMYPLKIKEVTSTLTFFVYTVGRMGYSDMPLILNFMQTIGYMRSSSICKAKLLYCTNTNTHQYTV